MTKSELRKLAKANFAEGKTKQETFEALKDASNLPVEKLAEIVQGFPSNAAKEKYKILNIVLMILLGITATFKILAGLPLVIELGVNWIPLLFILPIINIALLVGVGMYSPGVHKLVGIFSALGLLRYVSSINFNAIDVFVMIDLVIIISLIALGFYLHSALCPSYKKIGETYINEQGQKRMRYKISFPD